MLALASSITRCFRPREKDDRTGKHKLCARILWPTHELVFLSGDGGARTFSAHPTLRDHLRRLVVTTKRGTILHEGTHLAIHRNSILLTPPLAWPAARFAFDTALEAALNWKRTSNSCLDAGAAQMIWGESDPLRTSHTQKLPGTRALAPSPKSRTPPASPLRGAVLGTQGARSEPHSCNAAAQQLLGIWLLPSHIENTCQRRRLYHLPTEGLPVLDDDLRFFRHMFKPARS